ncbi:hypothetical protein [Hydrogenophaga electricum]|uniref:Glycine zipper family protein n=1 Tax=Hydrogenophaga electricum TaxID=1230953 RepID=A0ABQ6C145_9BURK|nr:hypothetical protein [Hydrogenophaga electricum]GLS13610.1 hypothetical protein GCM10007935_10400 [Hydrogenophaga electricum]
MKALIKAALLAAVALATLSGCAALDAAHIKGQEQDAAKYRAYSDVELQKQVNVQSCFDNARTDHQIAMCAMYGQGVGLASTFGGRPTATTIAPTTGQVIQGTATAVAPYAAGASIVKSATSVTSKDPVVVTQPEPTIVRPEVVIVP